MKAAGSDTAPRADHRNQVGNWFPDNLNAIERALDAIGPKIVAFAKAEHLPAHGEAVSVRLERAGD